MSPLRRSWQRGVGLGLSILLHAALLTAWTIPSCTARRDEDKPIDVTLSPPSAQGGNEIWSHPPPAARPCDPNNPVPPWEDYDLPPGPVKQRFITVASQAHYGYFGSEGDAEGRWSSALKGRFRPFDAARLVAGDAGLCIRLYVDPDGDYMGLQQCAAGETPLSRAMLPALAIGKDQALTPPCRSTDPQGTFTLEAAGAGKRSSMPDNSQRAKRASRVASNISAFA